MYRSKDDAARLQVFQLAHQVLASGSLGQLSFLVQVEAHALRLLTQELLAASKLLIQLLVQVVAVGHHHDGTLRELLYQPVHIEHHRQRFAAALCVPEHTNLAIAPNCFVRLGNRLVHGKVLVIGSHNLCRAPVLVVEADEVLQYVNQPLPTEDTFEESLVVNDLCRLRLTISRLPFHIAVLLGGECSGFRGQHVAGHGERIKDKQRGTFLLILFDLQIGIVFLYVIVGR